MMSSLPLGRSVIERWWWLSGLLLLALLVTVDILLDRQINGAFAVSAVLAALNADARRTTVVAVLATAASVGSGVWNANLGELNWAFRFATCLLLCGLAVLAAQSSQSRRRRQERATTMAQKVLDAMAVELTGARSVRGVADGFVGHTIGVLGASSAMVLALDADDVLRSITWRGRSGDGADQYQEISLSSDLPGSVATREGVDLHYRSSREIIAAFPDLADYYQTDVSLHLLPLRRGESTFGLLAMSFPSGVFTPAEDGFLHALAGALTSAVIRARELEEQDAVTQRAALLAEASLRLSRSLDLETTVAEVGRLLVPRFADWYSLQLLADGQLETVAVQHRDPETTAWANGLRNAFPTDMDAQAGSPQVVRTGRSEIHPYIPAELVEATATSEEHLSILKRLGLTSAVVAPLTGRTGVVGAITLIHAESGRRYNEADRSFLDELADRVALALDAASTFEQQSERLADVTRVAEAAQRAILAPPPARAGSLELSARYVSAAVAARVGGDLYEVVSGPTSVRLLVGDVRGKGLAAVRTATVVMGAFRAAAVDVGDIARVAREIDRRIRPYLLDVEDFVTAVLVDICVDGGFTVVSCGHPAPVLLTARGAVHPVDVDPATPLGLGAEPVITRGVMVPGDRLLLYTDGLIEARAPQGGFVDPTPFFGEVASAEFTTALDGLLASVTHASHHALEDDLALLLVGYHPEH